jgi:hypothetical protein
MSERQRANHEHGELPAAKRRALIGEPEASR